MSRSCQKGDRSLHGPNFGRADCRLSREKKSTQFVWWAEGTISTTSLWPSMKIALRWNWEGQAMDLHRYMDARRVSGVIVLKNGVVILERYGLGRTARDRWASQSMAKSVTSILIGAAIQDGNIKSVDSPVTDYILGT
ncbi:CubicO group peptidase (beta-lactamase class C family) [Bradyrhizobium japonicum]